MHSSDHSSTTLQLPDEAATLGLGRRLAACVVPGLVVYLSGELGAGKTSLARGILQGLGYTGRVKSPSFALVEVYKLSSLYLYHFDFYRFEDPHELTDAGFREYFSPSSACLIEWPERASGSLPAADLKISMAVSGEGRRIDIVAETEAGKKCLERLRE